MQMIWSCNKDTIYFKSLYVFAYIGWGSVGQVDMRWPAFTGTKIGRGAINTIVHSGPFISLPQLHDNQGIDEFVFLAGKSAQLFWRIGMQHSTPL
jgi:hypothetical protein